MGRSTRSSGGRGAGGGQSKTDLDNHANQLNPNNDAYHQSRGEKSRPENWDQAKDD